MSYICVVNNNILQSMSIQKERLLINGHHFDQFSFIIVDRFKMLVTKKTTVICFVDLWTWEEAGQYCIVHHVFTDYCIKY